MTDPLDPSRQADPNAAALARAYRAWIESRGADGSGFLALMADGIAMRVGMQTDAPEGVTPAEFLAAIQAEWEMRDYRVEKLVADGGDVVMIGHCVWRNRATDRLLDTPIVDIWRFENGKATDFLEMFDSDAYRKASV
jgi:ketosteroid isomerase-like protein